MVERARISLSREAVIETAVECMADEGISALGINRVARALGIRPPSLYHYVRSNEDLHLAVAVHGWRELIARLRAALETVAGPPGELGTGRAGREHLERRLRAAMHAQRDFARENPALHQTISVTALPHGDSRLMEVKAQLVELFGEIFAGWNLDSETLVHLVRAVRSAVHGFLLLQEAGQFPLDEVGIEESFDALVEMMVAGAVARAGKG